MKKILGLITTLALPVMLLACGGDDSTGPETPGTGTFSATVSGDLDTSFEGEAFFGEGTDPNTGETGWVLWLTTPETEDSGQVLYFVRSGSRPGTGTHDLGNLEEDDDLDSGGIGAIFINSASETFGGVYGSTGGSLVIEDSDSDRIQGSFTVHATGTTFQDGETAEANITITGEFDAVGGDVFTGM